MLDDDIVTRSWDSNLDCFGGDLSDIAQLAIFMRSLVEFSVTQELLQSLLRITTGNAELESTFCSGINSSEFV